MEKALILMCARGMSKQTSKKWYSSTVSLGKYLVVLTEVEYTLWPSSFTPR